MFDGTSKKFMGVYRAIHDGPFAVDPVSAFEVEFLSLEAIATHRQRGTQVFTPTFLTVLDFYLQQQPRP